MPSIRKRIGYLPSVNIQKIITNIASKEKLSQSKVVGMLVEEALIKRGIIDLQNKEELISNEEYSKGNNMHRLSYNYNDMDELISDKGVVYNTKKYRRDSNTFSTKPEEAFNEELLEQFKKFMLFQKTIEEN